VIGLPIHADAQESQSSMQARRFGKWLREVTGLPVCYVDERYTTQQAESMMRQGRLTIAERKKRRDMIAAQIILNTYLESPAIVNRAPEPLDDTDPFFVF
jgi:putative Holliday junction resolvase